jgi:hypoxanthine-guanine phosphoribosyltransferase
MYSLAADWTFVVAQVLNSGLRSLLVAPDPQSSPHVVSSTWHRTRPFPFAHPAEAIIANLLDRHGVSWLYEPTTFPLVTTPDGRPLQSFTPDFYLPECDTYIEMTTMRQSLVTRKNRKFRLLRERFPELNVRLLYRRDVELIGTFYGDHCQLANRPLGGLLVSDETINRRLHDMATDVGLTTHKSITVVALGDGARRFASELSQRLGEERRVPIRQVLLRQVRDDHATSRIQFGLSDQIDAHSRVLLAADVIGTGLTAHHARHWLADRRITVDSLVALADRKSARLVDVPLTSSIVAAPSTWLVGFGVGSVETDGLHLIDPQATNVPV